MDKSESQQQALGQQAEFQDCTPCRVMGGATFIGLGAYAWFNLPNETPRASNLPSWKGLSARIGPAIVKPLPWLLMGVGVIRLFGIDDNFRTAKSTRDES